MNHQALQKKVHAMIMTFNGYWSDTTNLLRINEELAELIEAVETKVLVNIEQEIADLMIVVLTIANNNQLIIAKRSTKKAIFCYEKWLIGVNKIIGNLARITTASAEKKPKAKEKIGNLQDNIEQLCSLIEEISRYYLVDLIKAAENKINANLVRDKNRFNC